MGENMVTRLVRIVNPTGLHVRPAGIFCREAMRFKSKITFDYSGNIANAKSVLSVLGTCVKAEDEITLICEGPDEKEALEHLAACIANGLTE